MRKIATTLLTLAAGLSVALGAAAPASAAPAITEIELTAGYNTIYRGGVISLSEYVPESTQIYLTAAACGRVLHTETFDGTVEIAASNGYPPEHLLLFTKVIDKSMAGPTVEVSVSFSDPSLPSASSTAYTHPGYPRSCDALEPAEDDNDNGGGITVQSWSAKKGNTAAKVGKTLKVTPTRATGSKVAYAWKVGTKIVDRDRAMTVKRSYKGKKVTMRVTVSMVGAKSVSKTLRYGTAR